MNDANEKLTSPPALPVPIRRTERPADDHVEVHAALVRIERDVAAVAAADVLPVSVDILAAVMTLLAAWPRLVPLFDAMARNRDIDLARIRALRDVALALASRQSDYVASLRPSPLAPVLVERGIAIRARALVDLDALARHGLIDATVLRSFGKTTGYKKVAQDLLGISNLVHEQWHRLQGKTLITLEEMDEAATLSTSILEIAAMRESATRRTSDITTYRDKTYTLFVRTYEQARRAVTFVRWDEGDADRILPSLYAGRGKRRRASARTSRVDPSIGGDAEV